MYHFRRTRKHYEQAKKTTKGCPFCDHAEIGYRIEQETKHTYVIRNKTAYDVWEHHRVLEHLLVIPKRHVEAFADLQDAELLEMARLFAAYEQRGFSIYARAGQNRNRSVTHQHTHLIRIASKIPRFLLFVEKPYILLHK